MPTAKARPGRPANIAPIEKAEPERTRPQGSEPARTPSITVFISVAWGAGSSVEPKGEACPRSSNAPAPPVGVAARGEGSVQPQATKTAATPSSVTRVMPEVGLDDTPMRPTIREDTTTKATPKTATPSAATRRGK